MKIGLIAGPVAFVVIRLLEPFGVEGASAGVFGVAVWMAIWWISEVLPLAVTALLPIVLFPLLGVANTRDAAAPYANEIVFLFLGGFLLATALERWNAHQRIALAVIGAVGTTSRRLVLGVMLATAFVSMWISNTATAAMMYPIAMAIGTRFGESDGAKSQRIALLLGVAFAASIGGMATLIGSPPNLIMAGAARELLGVEIDFFTFLKFGLPIAGILLPLCWAMLVFVLHREQLELDSSSVEALQNQRHSLGRLRGGELSTVVVFVTVALCWFFRAPKVIGDLRIPGLTDLLPGLTDAGIAIMAGIALFIVPARSDSTRLDSEPTRPLLVWQEARGIPWDVLILFGGGLSLASAMESSGLAAQIGVWMSALEGMPIVLVLLGLAAATVVISELASNSATAAMGMPIAVTLAGVLGEPPLLLLFLVGFAASIGFSLPMATPPNAIVFGSGAIKVRDMVRAGLLLDIMAVIVVVGVLLAVF